MAHLLQSLFEMFLVYFSLLVISSPSSELCWIASSFASDQPEIDFICEGEGGRFIGEIYRYEDRQLIQEFIHRSEGKIQDKTKLSDQLLKELTTALKANLKTQGIDSDIRRKGGELFLTKSVPNEVLERLRLIYPDLKILTRVKASKFESTVIIFLELAFVELKKEAVEKLGLRFGSPIEFGTSVYLKKILSPSELFRASGGNPVGSLIDFLLKEGSGKVHFKQSVVGQNGKRARFEVGGEYALRLSSENFSQLGSIRYGVELEFQPNILNDRQVHLLLDIQIREPDLAAGIDGLPLIQTKKLQSQIVTELEQTMAVGGFVRAQHLRSSHKLPVLGEIPFFGRLFESKDFLSNRSEAYLFITPRKLKSRWLPQMEEH